MECEISASTFIPVKKQSCPASSTIVRRVQDSDRNPLSTHIVTAPFLEGGAGPGDEQGRGKPGYVSNISFLLGARGRLRIDALREALQLIIDRHAVLRSVFAVSGEMLVQQPLEGVAVALPVADLAAALSEIATDGERPFAGGDVPRLRGHVFRLGPDDHVVSIIVDHLAADGVSLGILAAEWRSLYQSIKAGTPLRSHRPRRNTVTSSAGSIAGSQAKRLNGTAGPVSPNWRVCRHRVRERAPLLMRPRVCRSSWTGPLHNASQRSASAIALPPSWVCSPPMCRCWSSRQASRTW
jgi:hypothetical protein